ncbi:hypothetical protein BEL04_22280 [Mucilaginibacter sp. PPCGB 2223]|nr:hypothetical protein BEL04_22280 [Mucilaginibacter sp. PPCGB 2223]
MCLIGIKYARSLFEANRGNKAENIAKNTEEYLCVGEIEWRSKNQEIRQELLVRIPIFTHVLKLQSGK